VEGGLWTNANKTIAGLTLLVLLLSIEILTLICIFPDTSVEISLVSHLLGRAAVRQVHRRDDRRTSQVSLSGLHPYPPSTVG